MFKIWMKSIAKNLVDLAPTLVQVCILGPVVGRTMSRLSLTKPVSTRMAGQRWLATKTVDGAVIEGADVQVGAKFAMKNGLPTEEGERRLIIENEPHRLDGFDGEIKEGYGKGIKRLLYRGPVVVKLGKNTSVQTAEYHFHEAEKAGPHYDLTVSGVPSQQFRLRPRQFEIHFLGGPLQGKRYAIVNTIMREGTGGRMCVPLKDRTVTIPKPDVKLKTREWLADKSQNDWIAERKMDGSLCNAALIDFRAHLKSHRETSNTYYDKLPSVEWLGNTSRLWTCRTIFPGYKGSGTLLQVEAVHVQGVSKVSGILNSRPDTARAFQDENGPVEVYAWNVLKYRGRDVSGWDYARRRGLLEKIISEIRQYNKNWHIVDQARPGEKPIEFYDRVIGDRRGLPFSEGIVLKSRTEPDNWAKIKMSDAFDLTISKLIEGTGKFSGSLGAIEVISPATGERGEVGSLAIDDIERQWIWNNRSALIGAVAKVRALGTTERGIPRAGVFESFHTEKGSDEALALLASKEI